MPMLEEIKEPSDIKNYTDEETKELAAEIRRTILQTVSKNGGHLATNLGVVEATIALHRVFDITRDKLIFDVGHQCYAHKLLTGRSGQFHTLRTFGGISGFTNKDESPYDTVSAGHSGTSLSTALGIAAANKLKGSGAYTVAFIGDGSFTNGMIYEALNNCCERNIRLIILLNDNEMSISGNVGGLSRYLSSVRTSDRYFSFKHHLQKMLLHVPLIGKRLISAAKGIKSLLKRLLIKENFFENLGIDYLGPVDGNNIVKLEKVLTEAKTKNACCLVHMKTIKGLGYKFAEEKPHLYHSAAPFDIARGIEEEPSGSFASVFGDIVCEKASGDERICAVTAAMCAGTGLQKFAGLFPDRFFDVGIAEEHAVTFSGGLSINGMKPVCALYSTFAQRVYDQLMHDISLQNIGFILALSHCGLIPGDGQTHQGVFDYSLISAVPHVRISAPETYQEMREVFDSAFGSEEFNVIRYPKGAETEYDRSSFKYSGDRACSVLGEEEADAVIITYGRITEKAYHARRLLSGKRSVKIIKLIRIYPLDFNPIFNLCGSAKTICILEEAIHEGGLAEKITSAFALHPNTNNNVKFIANDVKDGFTQHGDLASLYTLCGFQAEQIADRILRSFAETD